MDKRTLVSTSIYGDVLSRTTMVDPKWYDQHPLGVCHTTHYLCTLQSGWEFNISPEHLWMYRRFTWPCRCLDALPVSFSRWWLINFDVTPLMQLSLSTITLQLLLSIFVQFWNMAAFSSRWMAQAGL